MFFQVDVSSDVVEDMVSAAQFELVISTLFVSAAAEVVSIRLVTSNEETSKEWNGYNISGFPRCVVNQNVQDAGLLESSASKSQGQAKASPAVRTRPGVTTIPELPSPLA